MKVNLSDYDIEFLRRGLRALEIHPNTSYLEGRTALEIESKLIKALEKDDARRKRKRRKNAKRD